jgi:predicted dehydrogenase
MSDEQNVSRRDLVRGGLTAAAVLGMPLSVARALEAAQDPKAAAADAVAAAKKAEPVNIAWLGTGTQGRNDMSKLVRMPGVNIVAIADIYDPYYELGLKMAGAQCQGYKDYRKLLERKDVDAVGIATPLHLHAQMAIDALEAGKHVYVEKMMAYTVEDARKMVKTAERTGKLLQVGHQRRYSVDYHHAASLVGPKAYFGPITHVRAQWNRRNNWRRPVPDPKFEKLLNWRLYKEFSRGLMAELGSHQIDVTNWFLGANMKGIADKDPKAPRWAGGDLHPIAVVGMGGVDYWKDGREVFDNVQVIFEYPNGQKLCYQSIETNEFDGYSEQFMGRNGTLVVSEAGNSMLFRERGVEEFGFEKYSQGKTKVNGKEAITLDAGATTSQDKRGATAGQTLAGGGSTKGKDNWYLSLEDWVDCIRTGRKPFCDGRIGMADVACVVAANKAMETGTRVKLTDDMFKV